MKPESASIEPSERSKPPVSITNVSPRETIQRIATPVSITRMFATVRKRGSWIENTITRHTRTTSTPTYWLPADQLASRPRRLGARVDAVSASLAEVTTPPSSSARGSPRSLRRGRARRRSGRATITRIRSHRRSSSAVSDELTRIPTPSSRASREQSVDLALRADVDAARRLVHHQDRWRPTQPFRDARPSAGCRR